MKTLLTLLLGIIAASGLNACTCDPNAPSFFDLVQSQDFFDSGGVIWEAEYIQEIPVSELHIATQFSIKDIWCGSFPSDLEMNSTVIWESELPNEENKIWVITQTAYNPCPENYGTNNVIVAMNHTWYPNSPYSFEACSNDAIRIFSDENEHHVKITLPGDSEYSEVSVSDFKSLVNEMGANVDCAITTSIENIEELELYPNPTSKFVVLPSLLERGELEVFNIQGRLMLKSEYTQRVDVSGLPTGRYFAHFRSNTGKIYQTDFLVTK